MSANVLNAFLDNVLCIYQLMRFENTKKKSGFFIKSKNAAKIMAPIYKLMQGLKVLLVNIKVPRIDKSIFKKFDLGLTSFQFEENL